MCEGDGIGDKDVCYVYISFFQVKLSGWSL